MRTTTVEDKISKIISYVTETKTRAPIICDSYMSTGSASKNQRQANHIYNIALSMIPNNIVVYIVPLNLGRFAVQFDYKSQNEE